MKKIFAIMLALVLVLAMGIPAMAATITINPNVPSNASSNNTYKAYQIFAATIDGTNVSYTIDSGSPFYSVISGKGDYFTLTQVGTSSTYIVEPKPAFNTEAAAKDLASALKGVITDSTDCVVATKPENSTNYVISDVADGYYLITSSVGSALMLDTFKTDTVTEKNTYPTIDKVADTATAEMGSVVTYTITVTIPANAVGEIVVHDTMTGLAYKELISVTAGGATLDTGASFVTTTSLEDGCALHFNLSAEFVAANKGKSVVITYTATVTADTAHNEAYLENGSYDSTTDTVEVKNYSLPVYKYTGSGDTKTGLAGAGFVLKNAAGKYYKFTAATEATPAKVEWVSTKDDATELTTSAVDQYVVTFTGLAAGTYTIEEKTVPAGYNPAQPVTVTIADDGKITVDGTELTKIEIQNNSGSELPSTGGIGTTIFYVVGGLLMAAAIVLLVTKKKVSSK